MIVVDSNVIAYLWIPGAHTAAAELVLRKNALWAAPLLWRSEMQKIIAGYLRRASMSADAALNILLQASTHLRGREFAVPSSEVLRFVQQSTCSAYDCEFVALAAHLQTLLVTQDKEVLRAFPEYARSMSHFIGT